MPNPNKNKKSYNPKKIFADPNFQAWYKFNTLEGLHGIAPESIKDYDFASYFGSGDYKNYQGVGHFPDTYKTPQHETFSNESIYSTPENPGGSWNEDNFNPKGDFQYKNGGKMKKKCKYDSGGLIPSNKVTKKQGLITTTEEVPLNLGYGTQDMAQLLPHAYASPIPQPVPTPVKKKKANSVTYEALQRAGKDIYAPVFHGDWTDKAKMNFYNSSPDSLYGNQILKGDALSNIDLSGQQAPSQIPQYAFPQTPQGYYPTYDKWGNDNQNYLPLLEDGGTVEAEKGFKLNPKHKGWCSPMTKSTCTGKRKQFAINAKNHFKKMDDGGDIPAQKSITYEQLQRPDHTMMYAPVFNGNWNYNDLKGAWNTIPDKVGENPVIKGEAWNNLYDGIKPGTNSSQWKRRVDSTKQMQMLNPYGTAVPRSGSFTPVHHEEDGAELTEGQFNRAVNTQMTPGVATKMAYGGNFDPYDFSSSQNMPSLGQVPDHLMNTDYQQPVQIDPQQVDVPDQENPFTKKKKKSGSTFSTPGTGDLLAAGLQLASNLLPEQEQANMYHKRNFGGYNPNAYGTGSQAIYANGGDIAGNNQLMIEGDKFSHISPNTIMINGDTHEDGGTKVQYGNNLIEAEKGEPLSIGNDGNAVIWGNMKVPGTNKKFKEIAKMLGKQEAKNSKLKDKGVTLLKEGDPLDSTTALAFNSGRAIDDAATQKSKVVASTKEALSSIQDKMLELAEMKKIDPKDLEKARDGKKMHPRFQSAFEKMLSEAPDYVKQAGVNIFSGYRDPEKQKALYANSDQTGHMVARPGHSEHEWGIAGDLRTSSGRLDNADPKVKQWIHDNASKYGLQFRMPWEPWHISLAPDKGANNWNGSYNENNYDGVVGNEVATSPINRGKKLIPRPIPKNFNEEEQVPMDIPATTDMPVLTMAGKNPFTSALDMQPVPVPAQVNNAPIVTPESVNKPSLADRNKPKLSNFLGEIAGVFDQPEPVKAKHFQPTLFDPYQVSFQDKLNENQSTFNSLQGQLPGNAEALSVLAGQKYQQDSSILGDQFRTNQAIANDVTNKNVGLLNQAEQTNLGIDDQQYVRQSQALANTRAHQNQAFASISDKLNQNRIENIGIRLRENLFDYRPDENYNMKYVGDGTIFVPGTGYINSTTGKVVQKIDPSGDTTTTITKDPLADQKLELAKKQGYRKWIGK